MVYKPLDEKKYLSYLRMVGWTLEKGIDWKLRDESGHFICTIKISHSKRGKQEVVAHSVHKTKQEFTERGLSWPPQKKSKNI